MGKNAEEFLGLVILGFVTDGGCIFVYVQVQSNPVLEAFGNAKTVRNDNSRSVGRILSCRKLWSSFSLMGFFRCHRAAGSVNLSRFSSTTVEEYRVLPYERIFWRDLESVRSRTRSGTTIAFTFFAQLPRRFSSAPCLVFPFTDDLSCKLLLRS